MRSLLHWFQGARLRFDAVLLAVLLKRYRALPVAAFVRPVTPIAVKTEPVCVMVITFVSLMTFKRKTAWRYKFSSRLGWALRSWNRQKD